MWDIDKQLRENEEAAKNSKIILHPSSIKTRIDTLSEEEAKAALELMINYAGALTSCNRCFLPPDCYGGKCKEAFLKWAISAESLEEAQHGHKRTD